MKKVNLFMLFFILLLSGCNNTSNKNDDKASASSAMPAEPSSTVRATASPTVAPTKAPQKQKLMASAKTKIYDNTQNRLKNMYLAADTITGYTLEKNKIFSFNEIVGKRTTEKGYKAAPVIIDGEKEMDEGGGVCQISTTIYQAAKKAGLKIIERHNHQKEVAYAKKGQDAAVNYETLDLKFLNNTKYPILFVVKIQGKNVIAEIYKITG